LDRRELLAAAKAATTARGKSYGNVYENHKRIADLWAVILKRPIAPHEVAMCMIALKIARLVETPNHADSQIDIAGYAAILPECFRDE
jgi:hypothetical protein